MKRRIDPTTFLSISLALFCIFIAISRSGSIIIFIDVTSIIIVVICTFLITAACFSFTELASSLKIIFKMMTTSTQDPSLIALSMLKIAEFGYKNNMLNLEESKLINNKPTFFMKNIKLVIDGEKPPQIEKTAYEEIQATSSYYSSAISILRKGTEIAPSMGLIGTLIGLVQMLSNLNDVKSIGPAMAVALLTTFYGAIIAYMILFPMAARLERNAENELMNMQIYLKTCLSIAARENPRYLEYNLNSVLPPEKQIKYFE